MRVSETHRGRHRCGQLLVLLTTLVRVVPRAAGVLRRLDDPGREFYPEFTLLNLQKINLKESLVL